MLVLHVDNFVLYVDTLDAYADVWVVYPDKLVLYDYMLVVCVNALASYFCVVKLVLYVDKWAMHLNNVRFISW